MSTDIKKAPTSGVYAMSVTRSGYTFRASWKCSQWMTSSDNDHRVTGMRARWALGITPGTDPTVTWEYGEVGSTGSSHVTFSGFKSSYSRSSFWPMTKVKVSYLTCTARGYNSFGSSSTPVSVTYKLDTPRKPTIAAYTINAQRGEISTTITTNAGTDRRERYDTEYYWYVRNSKTGAYLKKVHTTSTSTSIALTVDATGYQSLGTGYIQCTCKARSRGLAGNSDWVERKYYLSWPNAATIKSVDTPSSTTGTVIAYIKTNSTTTHPATKVQLQGLVDVEYDTIAEASAAASEWADVGGMDDGQCSALAVPVADVRPTTEGRHSWLRVKSTGPLDTLVRYSKPVELKKLYRPAYTAAGDPVRILDAHAGEDGESAVVLMGWAPGSNTDNSTGTELSWSSEQDTWRSTDEPNVFNVLYNDGTVTSGGTTYHGSATITIKGLEKGQTTYIKARRYYEGADATTYSSYSNTAMVTPAIVPSEVVLSAPAYVPSGSGVTLTWTYESDATQDAWRVMCGGKVVARGRNALGTCTLDAGRVASLATDNALELSVSVSMGGVWADSDARTVTIVEPPTLTATTAATLTAQPMAISATCDVANATLAVIVTSNGTSGDMPDGVRTQADGDVVWSGVVAPQWSNDAATVTLPDGCDFVDGADYTVTVRATDPTTGLSSETVTAQTTVAWAHQAPDPSESVTVTPDPTAKSATLTLAAPTGSVGTDVYDIYRLTQDGAQLIGEGWPLSATVTDAYAPYGDGMELAYRVACRTADGDVQWADVPYQLDGSAIRIDWAGQSVELPYNIAISDGYAKDVDVHEYLDGSTDAFFNEGIRRTAKLSTDVMRLTDADTIAAVLELAHHVGPAFVRTPTGAAYEADVQVESVAPTHELAAVSIDATEIRLTPAYQLPPYNVVEEE